MDAREGGKIAILIGSIFFYGNFKAETANERSLEILLRKNGFFFESEDELLKKIGEMPNAVLRGKPPHDEL